MIILKQIESNGMTIIQGCRIPASKFLERSIIETNNELLEDMVNHQRKKNYIQSENGEIYVEV